MTGMTLDELKETMMINDEIEFSYRGEMYDFQKDPADFSQTKISVWLCGDNPECLYSVTIADGEPFVEDLVNAKIFPDGKSIVDGEADIDVEFFT
ncbi:MAG: hypothetical protein IJL12_08415 [Selenomonadaceae bacterium]|nr:hypothetical protein [Selenomonadaceae bacterium]